MTTQEMATEIVKAWIAQRGQLASPSASKEIKEIFKAAVEAIEESYRNEE